MKRGDGSKLRVEKKLKIKKYFKMIWEIWKEDLPKSFVDWILFAPLLLLMLFILVKVLKL